MKIYTHEAIKSAALSSFDESAWTSTSGKETKATALANTVAWLYAVHRKRAGSMSGLPVELRNAGGKVDKTDWPIKVDMPDLLYRYSLANDLYGENYMFKVTRGSTVERVRWLQPNTITIEQSAHVGLAGFTRRIQDAAPKMYPVKDGISEVMWTWLPGMVEIGPGNPPSNVVEDAANILRYMSLTVKELFENGAIDSWVLFSPKINIASDDDKKNYMGYLKRLLKRGVKRPGEMWTLDPEARIESMNAPLNEWTLGELNDMRAEDICIAHDTPIMLLRPNEGADKAMMEQTRLMWINEVIIPAAQRMIDTLNEQLFDALGYEWVINAESMNINQEEETQRSVAVNNLVLAGETLANAYAILGYDLPEDYVTPEPRPEPEPVPVVEIEPEPEPEAKSFMRADEEKQYRRWLRKRPNPDIDDFNANHMTHESKAAIAYEVAKSQDATFRGRGDSDETPYP